MSENSANISLFNAFSFSNQKIKCNDCILKDFAKFFSHESLEDFEVVGPKAL